MQGDWIDYEHSYAHIESLYLKELAFHPNGEIQSYMMLLEHIETHMVKI